jgi:hypothetical protein
MASFCISCAAPLEPGTKFCGACGTAVEPLAANSGIQPAPASVQQVSYAHGRSYPALRIIAVILKVLAVITAIAGVVGGLSLSSFTGASYFPNAGAISALATLGGLLAGLCYALFLWASAEMINVVLDIEENTRRAAA